MSSTDVARPGRALLLVAAGLALVHAVPSLYWAAGGDAGVTSLGEWAPRWRAEQPVVAGLALVAICVVKLLGGVVPIWATDGVVRPRRLWRGLSWAGAALLIAYGGANVVVGGLALAGVLPAPTDPAALDALRGHVFGWDLLFLAWGLVLSAGLARTRQPA